MNTLKLDTESLRVESFTVEEIRPRFSVTALCDPESNDPGCPVDPNGTRFCTADSCTGAFICPCN